MRTLWLIANSMSRTTDSAAIDDACEMLRAHGFQLMRRVDLSTESLPDGEALPDIIACLGGDGTASAVIDHYGEREVPLLVLPGGTMNLLAHRLHGEADIPTIIERAAQTPRIVRLPQITGPDFRSLVGVVAGATAAWGDVREALRSGDVEGMVEQARAALEATLSEPGVRIGGRGRRYTALFIEPLNDALRAQEIKADTLSDLAQHGWAWLTRNFLGGPTEPVMRAAEITLDDRTGELALLVDGERMRAASPLLLRWEMCPARFLSTLDG
jgi:hypothetical protein